MGFKQYVLLMRLLIVIAGHLYLMNRNNTLFQASDSYMTNQLTNIEKALTKMEAENSGEYTA